MKQEKLFEEYEKGVYFRKEPANAGEHEKWYISRSPEGQLVIMFATTYTLEQAVKLFKVASKLSL